MRVIALAVCLLLLLGLSACGAKIPPLQASFSSAVSIISRDSKQAARLEAERPGVLRLIYTAPETIAGMEIRIENEDASIAYMGMRTPVRSLPKESAAVLLNQVLLQLAQPPEKKVLRRMRGSGWERKGTANGLEYTARLNEAGALQSLKTSGLEILFG